MYARSTTVRGNPKAMDDGIAYVRDTVMPTVQQMDGCIGLSMLADRDSGRCIVTTSWADADAMNAQRERRAWPCGSAPRRSWAAPPTCRSGRSPSCTGCTRPTTAPAPA